MSQDDILRLRAYLDQEEAEIHRIWSETEPDAKKDFLEWAASDTEAKAESEMEWIDFAARIALFYLGERICQVKHNC